MAYRNLLQFIDLLDKEGELIRVNEYVNPVLEIAEITDRISKTSGGGGKRYFFKIQATIFPY
jgi:4-hydroxy-3-polyprenylbenzoate decarboxylase